jgi:hypothetical protein
MRDSQSLAALHAALRFAVTSDIPSDHKAEIINALTQVIRDEENAHSRARAAEQPGKSWEAHENDLLQSWLQGKVANSWQQADEFVMRLVAQLHRDPRDIRAKATALGLGAGVDYRLAKALRLARQQE